MQYDDDAKERIAAKKRYEIKKVLWFCATVTSPLVAHWLGFPEAGPYVFSFLLVITFAHIVDDQINAAVRRARGL